MSSQVIASLVIGIPTVIFAALSWLLADRARLRTEAAGRAAVDAEAYMRAKEMYEAGIAELQRQLASAHGELAAAQERIRELMKQQKEGA